MALIKCKECGAMISDKAGHCPHCGAPVEATACKECGETVLKNALVCPHCGAALKVVYHMGFQEAVTTCFRKYATFTGRARRAEYWYFLLYVFLLNMLVYFLSFSSVITQTTANVLNILIFVATIIPTMAVTVRRFHDFNKSGWNLLWLIIACISSILIILYFSLGGDPETQTIRYLFVVAFACNVVGLIVVLIWPITKSFDGENQYGPSPMYKDIE